MSAQDYDYYRGVAEKRKWEAWHEFGWEKGIKEAAKLYAKVSP